MRWHRWVLRHKVASIRHVSVPMFDPGAKGLLVTCGCGEVWAL